MGKWNNYRLMYKKNYKLMISKDKRWEDPQFQEEIQLWHKNM